METDDKTLVERILKGETDEFRHLMRRHGGTLLAFIEGITHSREEAEDILQEAFVCAYRSLHQYNIKTASFATWLHHIAYHQALRQRKKRRLPAFSWDEDERLLATATERDTNEEAIETTEERMKLLDNAISHLPDYDRIYRFIRGYALSNSVTVASNDFLGTYEEIAIGVNQKNRRPLMVGAALKGTDLYLIRTEGDVGSHAWLPRAWAEDNPVHP